MRLVVHPAARREIESAFAWYCIEAGHTMATRFVDELDHLQRMLLEHPQIGEKRRGGTRRVIFSRFPYTLVYRIHGDLLQIIALAHQNRAPEYWVGRA